MLPLATRTALQACTQEVQVQRIILRYINKIVACDIRRSQTILSCPGGGWPQRMYDASEWTDVIFKFLYRLFRRKTMISTIGSKDLLAALQHKWGSLFGRKRLWVSTARALRTLDEHMGLCCERKRIQGHNTAFKPFVMSRDNPFRCLSRSHT